MFRTLIRATLAALILGLSLPPNGLRAEGQPAATIVFDGSGSIWGRIEGTRAAKIDVARDAIRALLGGRLSQAVVGLASYGHRRKSDCSDVEVIVPPEAGAAERVGAALDKLNPRGKGPITLAVREAAKQIGDRRPASIVLVTDNADNCRPDFCDLGEDLARTQPGLAVHIVGIALEADEIPRTQCVAKATGGRFYDARDATQLTQGLTEVLNLALALPTDRRQPHDTAGGPQLQAPPQRAQRPAPSPGKPSLVATAVLGGDDGPQLTVPLRWRVLASGTTATVLSSTGPALDVPLAAGKYTVEAGLNGVTARREVEVPAAGPASIRIGLPAGLVKVVTGAMKPPAAPALLTVSPDAAGAPPLLVSRDADADLLLAPGTYRLRAGQGQVSAEARVTVAAGQVVSAELGLAAARIDLAAAATGDGPPLDGATFIIATEENGGTWREIARSAAKSPSFIVQAGNYRVTARIGEAQAHQRIVVVAGETAKRTLLLSLGRLKLSASLPPAASAPVTFRITPLDGDAGDSTLVTSDHPELSLPTGRYRVEAQAGTQNVRAEATLAVSPGRDSQQDLKLAAAAVTLRPVSGAAAASDIYWEVREAASGRVVWRSASAEPRGLLAPGRYSVRMESRDRRQEKTFDLAAGEARTIEVGGI